MIISATHHIKASNMIYSHERFSIHTTIQSINIESGHDDRGFDYIPVYKNPDSRICVHKYVKIYGKKMCNDKMYNLSVSIVRRHYNRNTRENKARTYHYKNALAGIPYYQRNRNVLEEILSTNGRMIEFVAQDMITPQLARIAVETSLSAIKYLPGYLNDNDECMITEKMLIKARDYARFFRDNANFIDIVLRHWKGYEIYLRERLFDIISPQRKNIYFPNTQITEL